MIHLLDTCHLGRAGIIGALAVETREGLLLFDTGPESTFDNIKDVLKKIGFQPSDVCHVLLSHIHLDHAGAAWRFAEEGAMIHVHPRGAPHLLDPSRLVESARRIFGRNMDRLWGRIEPVRRAQLHVLEDGDFLQAGGRKVQAIATPGHATHHHVYHWDNNVFGGDVAGVRMSNGPAVPPFVPPELQIEDWLVSIEKIRALGATNLYLPHFGLVERAITEHLDALAERVRRWSEWFRDRLREGASNDTMITRFASYEHSELLKDSSNHEMIANYEAADPSHMAVPAATRYWQRYHPDTLAS